MLPITAGEKWVGPPGFTHSRALRDGLAIAGLLFGAYLFVIVAPGARTVGFDAFAYWSVNLDHPYARVAGELGAFPYTPIAARLFAPAAHLSWPSFWWLWSAALVGTVLWLGWRQALLVLAFPPVAFELYHGNVHLLIAAAIALGIRYPAAWAFVLVTKVTPGVGLVWFLVRREWRPLGIALGVTAILVAVSLAVDGRLWREWVEDGLLPVANGPTQQFYIGIPLLIRLPAAAVLVAWGARTDRAWTIPAGAALALPVLWISGLSILAAIPAINRLRSSDRQRPGEWDRLPLGRAR
jgi:glycosyl transferase family 87